MTVPEFASQTFGSSAASITMESVDVRAVRSGAFSANTYNIVMAVNCSYHLIEGESFAQNSLINNLYFSGCRIHQFASKALQSAVANLNISRTRLVFFYFRKDTEKIIIEYQVGNKKSKSIF